MRVRVRLQLVFILGYDASALLTLCAATAQSQTLLASEQEAWRQLSMLNQELRDQLTGINGKVSVHMCNQSSSAEPLTTGFRTSWRISSCRRPSSPQCLEIEIPCYRAS